MVDRKTGKLFGSTVVAITAGIVASVFTLLISSYFGQFAQSAKQADLAIATEQVNVSAIKAQAELEQIDTAEAIVEVHSELRQALGEASAERSQLAKVLAQLSQKLENLESEMLDQRALVERDDNALAVGSEAFPYIEGTGVVEHDGEQGGSERTIQNLVAVGLDPQTAGDVQARRDQYQLARLELFDQATREGWIGSDEFDNRLSELSGQQVDLRDELGDSAYDQYLFESGRNNRVGIESVINGSAAQLAGLQRGDIVTSYADELVFSTRELQAATRAGSRGEYVQVSFDRAGQALSTDVPRGPLGVTLRSSRVEP